MTIDRVRDLCQKAQEALSHASKSPKPTGVRRPESGEGLPLALAEKALNLAKDEIGSESYPYLQALAVYGTVLAETQGVEAALGAFEQAESLAKALLSPDPERALHVLGQVARWFARSDYPERAQRLLSEMIQYSREIYGDDHPRSLLLQSEGSRWLTSKGERPLGLWHF
jgi:hypothetical protein